MKSSRDTVLQLHGLLQQQEKRFFSLKRLLTAFRWLLQIKWRSLLFILMNALFMGIIVLSIFLSVKKYNVFAGSLDLDMAKFICEYTTAIVTLIVSTIGISISLQQEDRFGVSVREFNKLRPELHYSITAFIVLSILMLVSNVICCVIELYIVSLGISCVSILFCIYIVCYEVPYMMKSEKRMWRTIKSALLCEWKYKRREIKNLNTVLETLLTEDNNLKDTFYKFKSVDDKFNNFLASRLLDVLQNVPAKISDTESKRKRDEMIDSIMRNLMDILYFDFDILPFYSHAPLNCYRKIVYLIVRLRNISEYEERIDDLIATSLTQLRTEHPSEKADFIMLIVLSIATNCIREGDFSFIKTIQERISVRYYELGKDNYESILFALLSMQMYFLCNNSNYASDKLKNAITEYIKWTGIRHYTRVYSWISLFSAFINQLNINFEKFIYYFSCNELDFDVKRYFDVQFVALTREYVFDWYLTCVLCSYNADRYDFAKLCVEDDCRRYLKRFGDQCFQGTDVFTIPQKSESIIKFYQQRKDGLELFIMMENRTHRLFQFINNLKENDLQQEIAKAKSVRNEEIALEYQTDMINLIRNEWGYDKNIAVSSSRLKSLSIQFEKSSRAINYKEVILNVLKRSLFQEIRNNTHYNAIERKEDFIEKLEKPLKANYKYVNEDTESLSYYIKDKEQKDEYISFLSEAEKFSSNIFIESTFVKENGFSFNLQFDTFAMRDLTEAEADEEVAKYKRADGQYVLEGTFLTREKIKEYILAKYGVLTISIRYVVRTFLNSIVEVTFNKMGANLVK